MNNNKMILNAPGLVGKIATYINETSYKEQPILALAAAIVATGAFYGHRLRTRTNLRTNIMVFALGESGAGKDGSRVAVKILLDAMPESFSKMACGNPISAPGLLAALNKAGGVGVFLIDEIGHFIASINGKKAPSHAAEIMGLLTQLFTSANTTFRGGEYSDRAKDAKPRVDIIQPCVCFLGSSTPDRVYNAISLDDVADGFLPRWLVLESDDIAPANNPAHKNFDKSTGAALAKEIPEIVGAADLSAPRCVIPDDEARQILDSFADTVDKLRQKAITGGSNMKYIYTRAAEHAEKLALIACEYKNAAPVITAQSAAWAVAVVNYSVEKMRRMIEKVAASPHEQAMNDMAEIIARRGKMAGTDFCNYCRRWKLKEREELLKDLVACGRAKQYREDGTTYIEPTQNVENVPNV
ncbi:hypothetical protein AGMMS50222_03930 [Endomicrobiia bacterium]|nr:hypothetical protein AGMMS50222_03930 [Endomicrobiia bacterium]